MNAQPFTAAEGAETFRTSISAPCGSVAELRAFIGETIGLAAIQAGLAETYAALGDDAGLEYAMRRFAAYSNAAFATLVDLKAANIKGAADGRE
jgi:hypothetical protein